jgi:hypothetical protein
MENFKKHLNIRNQSEIVTAIDQTMLRIKEYVKFNEYQIHGNIEEKLNLDAALKDATLRKRKTLRRYMYHIEQHPTLPTVNKFLHFLFKTVLKSDVRVRVLKSEQELEIQKRRKEFKDALKVMLEKKQAYLDSKGDFYKKRILNKQAI